MFSIDSTGTIKITKGEDSGDFNLTLFSDRSLGKEKCWITRPIEIYKMPNQLNVDLDKDTFREAVGGLSGFYCFEYSYPKKKLEDGSYIRDGLDGWYLSAQVKDVKPTKVNLSAYGITYLGDPKYLDLIIIRFAEYDIDEIVFKIRSLYDSETVFEKTFSSEDDTLIGEFGDVILNLTAEDLADLNKGEYRYLIFLNSYNGNSVNSQAVTRILPFYIL